MMNKSKPRCYVPKEDSKFAVILTARQVKMLNKLRKLYSKPNSTFRLQASYTGIGMTLVVRIGDTTHDITDTENW